MAGPFFVTEWERLEYEREQQMKSGTATAADISADNDLHAARRFGDVMVNMLRDFIPDHCRRDARDLLIKAAFDQGFELTTRGMRKQYEAWKSTQLEGLLPRDLGERARET